MEQDPNRIFLEVIYQSEFFRKFLKKNFLSFQSIDSTWTKKLKGQDLSSLRIFGNFLTSRNDTNFTFPSKKIFSIFNSKIFFHQLLLPRSIFISCRVLEIRTLNTSSPLKSQINSSKLIFFLSRWITKSFVASKKEVEFHQNQWSIHLI